MKEASFAAGRSFIYACDQPRGTKFHKAADLGPMGQSTGRITPENWCLCSEQSVKVFVWD